MGMPTDATYGFLGQGVSSIGNMFAANTVASGQLSFLEGQKSIADRQLNIDSERVNFESVLRADYIRHSAELETMLTDMRISDAKRREDLIRQRAKSLLYAAGNQEKRLRERGRAVIGAQRAGIAGSGFSGDSGSYAEIVRQSGDLIEEDAGILRYNTQLAMFGVDMEAAGAAREYQADEIYRSGIGKMAGIESKMTLLAGESEKVALRAKTNITKLNIDAQKFAVQQQRAAALVGGITDVFGALDNAWKSLQKAPVKKSDTPVRIPTYNLVKPGDGGMASYRNTMLSV